MKKFVSYEKMSKKQKKELNNRKRTFWNVNPASKIIPNKKKYSRKVKHKNDIYA